MLLSRWIYIIKPFSSVGNWTQELVVRGIRITTEAKGAWNVAKEIVIRLMLHAGEYCDSCEEWNADKKRGVIQKQRKCGVVKTPVIHFAGRRFYRSHRNIFNRK